MTSISWSNEEFLVLTHAYIHVYETSKLNDPMFWSRLTNIFNAENRMATRNDRDELDILARWYEMKTEVLLFNDLYTKIDDTRLNATEDVILEAAKEEYKSLSNGLEFQFEAPWNILKYIPFV
mgnify:FL=1